jgi:hypothetical protein
MNKLGISLICVATFAALLAAPQAWAQVYKCVDAAGKTVYLQSPCPPGQSSKVISSKPVPAQEAPPAKPGAKAPLSPEQEFRKRQKDREEAEKKANEQSADAKRRQENCARAKEQLSLLEIGGRISRANEKGERYFLEDGQIAQEKAKAQASVAEWCK